MSEWPIHGLLRHDSTPEQIYEFVTSLDEFDAHKAFFRNQGDDIASWKKLDDTIRTWKREHGMGDKHRAFLHHRLHVLKQPNPEAHLYPSIAYQLKKQRKEAQGDAPRAKRAAAPSSPARIPVNNKTPPVVRLDRKVDAILKALESRPRILSPVDLSAAPAQSPMLDNDDHMPMYDPIGHLDSQLVDENQFMVDEPAPSIHRERIARESSTELIKQVQRKLEQEFSEKLEEARRGMRREIEAAVRESRPESKHDEPVLASIVPSPSADDKAERIKKREMAKRASPASPKIARALPVDRDTRVKTEAKRKAEPGPLTDSAKKRRDNSNPKHRAPKGQFFNEEQQRRFDAVPAFYDQITVRDRRYETLRYLMRILVDELIAEHKHSHGKWRKSYQFKFLKSRPGVGLTKEFTRKDEAVRFQQYARDYFFRQLERDTVDDGLRHSSKKIRPLIVQYWNELHPDDELEDVDDDGDEEEEEDGDEEEVDESESSEINIAD